MELHEVPYNNGVNLVDIPFNRPVYKEEIARMASAIYDLSVTKCQTVIVCFMRKDELVDVQNCLALYPVPGVEVIHSELSKKERARCLCESYVLLTTTLAIKSVSDLSRFKKLLFFRVRTNNVARRVVQKLFQQGKEKRA